MKHLISVLLFLALMLCSCSGASGGVSPSDNPIPIQSSAADDSDPDILISAEDTTDVSSDSELTAATRYEKQYKITTLSRVIANSSFYQYNDRIYQISWNYDTKPRRICLTSWNADGSEAETIYYPEPEPNLPFVPSYIYPLTDGRTLMIHFAGTATSDAVLTKGYCDTVFTLLSEDNTVLCRTEIPELQYHTSESYCSFALYEEENGSFTLMAALFGKLYLYDETLTQQNVINVNAQGIIGRLDNGDVRVGMNPTDLKKVNPEQGIARQHGGLRLPSSMRSSRIYGCYTDQIYLSTNTGIYRWQDDGQPKQLLEWEDTPFTYTQILEGSNSGIWICSDYSLFICAQAWDNGSLVSGLYHIAVTDVPLSDKTVLDLAYLGSRENEWLNQMIYQFNQENREYRIELRNYACTSQEAARTQLDTLLLEQSHPDLIFSNYGDVFSHHNDKNAYLDLMDVIGGSLFGCVREIFAEEDALYQLSVSMTASFAVAPSSVVEGALTWDKLESLMQTLAPQEILTSSTNLDTHIYENTPMQFVDRQAMTSSFDSDAFRRAIILLDVLDSAADESAGILADGPATYYKYGITNGTLHRRLADGAVKLLEFNLDSLEAYAALKLLFHDIPFTFCGFPTEDGQLCADISTNSLISVPADTDAKDGGLAFLSYLISDAAQTDSKLIETALPVTPSAMQALFSLNRYQYYDDISIIEKLTGTPDTGIVFLSWRGTTPQYRPDFGNTGDGAADLFYISQFTNEDEERVIQFFNEVTTYKVADPTVQSIVNEEMSAWKYGVRSLEETTKIIDSRVWIYLNE